MNQYYLLRWFKKLNVKWINLEKSIELAILQSFFNISQNFVHINQHYKLVSVVKNGTYVGATFFIHAFSVSLTLLTITKERFSQLHNIEQNIEINAATGH